MVLPDEMTQDEAVATVREIFDRFGFSGTYFNRADVEAWMDRPITDDEFNRVVETRTWMRDMPAKMCEQGWDGVGYACDEAGLDRTAAVE